MIEILNLCKSFGNNIVLKDLTLSVKTGETKVVIGRSGVGKSVFLKSIIGLIKPDSGSIKIDGQEVVNLSEREYNKFRMEIGMVFQGGALFDSLNVGENVSFVLDEFTKTDKKIIRSRVEESLGLVGLKGIEEMMPAELSGGMKKRVSLARVLCMKPQVIFYDEPQIASDVNCCYS